MAVVVPMVKLFTLSRSKSDEEIGDLMNFYDYIEVQPQKYINILLI